MIMEKRGNSNGYDFGNTTMRKGNNRRFQSAQRPGNSSIFHRSHESQGDCSIEYVQLLTKGKGREYSF